MILDNDHYCLLCKKDLSDYRSTIKYCSSMCQRKYRLKLQNKRLIRKRCKTCKLFINDYYGKKFCSNHCRYIFNYDSNASKIRHNIRKQYAIIKNDFIYCFYCNKYMKEKTIEHIIPRIDFLGNNIVIVCNSCNSSKGKKDLLEWSKNKRIDLSKECIDKYYKLKALDDYHKSL